MRERIGEGGARKAPALGILGLAVAAALPVAAGAQEGEPLFRLDTLQVDVASRTTADFPVRSRAVEVLTARRIRELPVRTVAGALRWMAGMDLRSRSPAQTDLSVRGGTFEQVLVMVDGVRVSDPQTGHFDLDLAVPLERVERIEVLRGPASALYGADAVGGVVNVVTRREGSGVSGLLEGGSFGTVRANASVDGAAGGLRTGATGEWSRSDGHREGTDYETLLFHGHAGAELAGGRLRLRAGHGRRDFGADRFYAPFPSWEETRSTTVTAGWRRELAGEWVLEPRLSWRRHDDDFVLIRTDPATYENVHVSSQSGGELVVRHRPTEDLALAVGGEAYRDALESDGIRGGSPVAALGHRSELRGAVFGEAALGSERWSATAGLRLDGHEGFGTAWSPSVSASVDVSDRVRLRGAWGRSFRAPTWTERYYEDPANVGDPDLDAERGWSGEVGADAALPGGGTLGLTAYHREGEGLIDWVRPEGSGDDVPRQVRNVETATYDGLELSLEALAAAGLRLSGSGTLLSLETGGARGLVGRYALNPLLQRGMVAVARPLLGGDLVLSGRFLHQRRVGEEGTELVDLRALVGLPRGELHLDVTNLTDREHTDLTGNPAPGRALMVGYRLELGGG